MRPTESIAMSLANDAPRFRAGVILALFVMVAAPALLVIYQSVLDAPFFDDNVRFSLDAFRFVLTDPEFYRALWTTTLYAFGMVVVAVPLGGLLAFLITRTDLKGRKWLEPIVLVPMFLSSIVLAFGYTVSVGPSGFVTIAFKSLFGAAPWSIYTLPGIILIGGLSHVPTVYLYVASAMRRLPSDLEEAARTAGAGIWRVSLDVTLPMVLPALVFSAALNLLLGFETFGIPLVLGDPNGILVLTTYIYKVNTIFGAPTYQVMAAVTVFLILITLPLVFIQRRLLRHARRFAAVGGKGARTNLLRLGSTGQAVALGLIGLWLLVSVFFPVGGIVLRAFVENWGEGVRLTEQLTLANFKAVFEIPSLSRGILNTILLAGVGGAIAVAFYLLVGLAGHRNRGRSGTLLDYSVLIPRALPGLIVGLTFFWLFLFVPFLIPLRATLISLLIAYIIVGLSYGLRIIQSTLLQVAPELEESARITGASVYRSWRDVVIPLVRPGLAGAWAMIMIVFLREYATGVYLMSSGTEVIGSLMVSLLTSGAMDQIAALSFISIALTAVGLTLALRLGAKLHD
ncbi:iron(III) transport system permease protein [Bosea sp. OK403]|uniref:ABC transporter permease n=1 Tax=Bosea sp. OK403 TaxID=1855286 RepID=UPI0008E1B8F9|nr:iron ABC transporter permease [Bosea sp. OK403]SFI48377.1 iron(III) transport system permease protein [Bosea sp. OK403]